LILRIHDVFLFGFLYFYMRDNMQGSVSSEMQNLSDSSSCQDTTMFMFTEGTGVLREASAITASTDQCVSQQARHLVLQVNSKMLKGGPAFEDSHASIEVG
jgi:hypothetical protein